MLRLYLIFIFIISNGKRFYVGSGSHVFLFVCSLLILVLSVLSSLVYLDK